MDNNKKEPFEKDVQVYDSSSKKPVRARRDVQTKKEEVDNSALTRVDMPTITEDIIIPERRAKKTPSSPVKKTSEPSEDLRVAFLEEGEDEEGDTGKNMLSALGKSFIYLIFVLCSSIIVSYFAITMINDLFAFVKDDNEVKIVVDDETTFKSLASDLEKAGVVKYPTALRIYNSFKNRDATSPQELEVGEHVISSNLNYDEIIYTFMKKAPPREIVRITFPEGITADEIIDLFLENGIGTREGFEEAISSSLHYDMDYKFLKDLQETEKAGEFRDGRRFVLEGYLYPDTYDFYTDSTEINAVAKLLATFNKRFEDAYYERCEELGMSVDEVVNLASIIQKETKWEAEYETVSSLYHNRLNNPSSFPRLQCDSTYLYAYPERRANLTLDEMKASENPYSTYSHDGLPPSAICSPSLNAIISAMYPNSTDINGVKHTYYYMVARKNGYHYFATDSNTHQNNIARAAKEAE